MKPIIFGGSQGKTLALKLAEYMKIPLGEVIVKSFPDGETYVRFIDQVKDRPAIIVNSMYRRPNEILVELLLEIETLKDLGASRIIGVIPYFAYARQDARFNPGEAVSIQVVSKLLRNSGLNELITVDMHLHRIDRPEYLFQIPVHNITAMGELAKYVMSHYNLHDPVVIGPDEESEQWARTAAKVLNVNYDILEKERISAEEVIIKAKTLDVKDKDVIVVDDIISTGGTMAEAIKALKGLGANNVIATCTHALLIGDAYYKVLRAGAKDIVATDSVLSPVSRVSIVPLLAEALKRRL